MPARLRRTVRSFAVVFAAFWVYRLLVSPWIDPSFEIVEQSVATETDVNRAREADELRLRKYAGIFPPGSWELKEPIMIESEGVELLMKDYENLAGGRIRLSQCTILYLAPDGADARDPGRVVILRAPEGAVLQFDSDLNLRRGKVGKLKGGELRGPVTIHGAPSRPGADDELFVATRDLQMDERNIWSDNTVQFRYGPNQGVGRGLVIKLLAAEGSSGQRRGPNIGGFERIELLRDVKMTLQPGSTGLFPGDEDATAATAPLPDPVTGQVANRESPVEVRCRGPFHVDLAKRMASFRDHVEVARMLDGGATDRLACEELRIFFGDKQQMAQSPNPDLQSEVTAGQNQQGRTLQIDRLIAIGNPATVVAPSSAVQIRGNRLDFENGRRRMVVEAAPSQPDASLIWGDNEFGGRSLVVERPTPKALPLVTAKGAGWFEIADPDNPGTTVKARWTRELFMRPDEGSHRVSLIGDAETQFAQMGELHARQIDLWLVQLDGPTARTVVARASHENVSASSHSSKRPAKRGQPRNPVTPLRLLAVGDVRFNSHQLTGDSGELQVWFDPAGTLRPTPPKIIGSRTGPFGGPLTADAASPVRTASPGAATAAEVQSGSSNSLSSAQPELPRQHFELHGNSIQARLVSQGEQTSVNFVEINGQVRLIETQSKQPAQRPIEIRGDWLQVQNASEPQRTTVVVTGKPALMAARDMEMRGDRINLDRGRNLLWINGAGRMILPPPRTSRARGEPAAATSRSQFASFNSLSDAPVQIDFLGGMRFDGRVARYDRQVNIHSQTQAVRPNHPNALETRRRELKTEVVEVTLQKPVDFAAEQSADDAEVDTIACLGPVLMTEQTHDNRGLIAVATLSTRDLSIRQTTGKIHALGPGTLRSTRLDSADLVLSRNATKPASTKTADEPVYMRVDYEGEITGNLHQEVYQLHDDIRGVYGPVKRWGDELPLNPNPIGPRQLIFGADKLQVSQAPDADPSASSLEFRAEGNTRVDGQTFSATAHQLSYVQGKGQLTLKGAGPKAGEGHNDAVLYYQQRPGGPQNELKAGTIDYWPSTNHNVLDKARTFQFFDVGQ